MNQVEIAIERMLKRLDTLEARESPDNSGWIDLPYTAGWEDYSASFNDGQYRKVGDRIETRGMCKRSSGSSLVVATLPAGFRPSKYLLHPVIQANDTAARITIKSTGDLELTDATSNFAWLSLEMSFAL